MPSKSSRFNFKLSIYKSIGFILFLLFFTATTTIETGCANIRFSHLKGGGYVSTPSSRTGASSIVVGNSLYVIGGQTFDDMGSDGGSFLRSVVRANINPDGSISNWVEQPPLDFPRGYASLVNLGKKLYVIGGYKDNNAGDTGAIPGILSATINDDGNLSAWENASSGFTQSRGGSALLNKDLFLFGGISAGGSPTDKIMKTTILQNGSLESMSVAGQLSYPRNRFATVTSNNGIYVIGGYRGGFPNAYDGSVEKIVPSSDNKSVIVQMQAPLPTRRGNHSAIEVAGKIITIGGYDGNNYLDRIDIAKIDENGQLQQWLYSGKIKVPRANHTLAVYKSTLYVIGGGNKAGIVPIIEKIDLKQLGVL